jgi:hypothetical protein
MSVVLAVRAKLSAAVREKMQGEIYDHHGARLARVPDKLHSSEGPSQLVRLAQRRKAQVLVVDVRLGGQRYFAMDAVRTLLEVPDNGLAVIIITPAITHALAKHSWEIGVFSAIEEVSQTREALAAQVAEQVCRAFSWREGLSPRQLTWLRDLGPHQPNDSSAPRRQRQGRKTVA